MNDLKTYTTCNKCHSVNRIAISSIDKKRPVCGKCGGEINMHGLVTDTTSDGLLKIIEKSELPVVVDFWAPWCGPCRMFAPTFETASKMFGGKVVFLKLNTENFPEISSRFNIRGIPSLLVFKNGREIGRESGAFPLDHLKNWLSKYI